MAAYLGEGRRADCVGEAIIRGQGTKLESGFQKSPARGWISSGTLRMIATLSIMGTPPVRRRSEVGAAAVLALVGGRILVCAAGRMPGLPEVTFRRRPSDLPLGRRHHSGRSGRTASA